jgi:Ni/Co efflux regulator RcnB
MKKFLLSLAAASTVLAAPIAANASDFNHNDRGRVEQRYDPHDNGSRYQVQRYQAQRYQAQEYQAQEYRSFRKGDRFDSRYARNYQVIGNPYAYGLRAAPRGEHWVRSGNEALLVGLVGGVIGAVVANAF